MEALSLLEKLDIDPAIKAALAAGFQTDIERAQSQHKARALALETRIQHDHFIIEKLKLELAHLRRIQFGRKSESLKGEQQDLFNEAVAEDLGNLSEEMDVLTSDVNERKGRKARTRAGRQPLPSHLPVVEYRHDLESCRCDRCGQEQIQIGEDPSTGSGQVSPTNSTSSQRSLRSTATFGRSTPAGIAKQSRRRLWRLRSLREAWPPQVFWPGF